jgi:hypothetical protein
MNSKSVIEAAGRIGDLCRETMDAIADNKLDEAKRSADLALVVSLGVLRIRFAIVVHRW